MGLGGRGEVVPSDAERQAVVERLAKACGEGRFSLDEFETKIE